MTVAAEVASTVAGLRREVCALHAELTRYQLVVWTAGNVSARVPGHDLLVIKPSGVSYDELTPDNMVVCDLHGRVVEGEHAPSSDTEAQAYVYREMPEVGGVVHTHSTYATAWAARGSGGASGAGVASIAVVALSMRRTKSWIRSSGSSGPFSALAAFAAGVMAAILRAVAAIWPHSLALSRARAWTAGSSLVSATAQASSRACISLACRASHH